ncbi:glycerol-3-phosphate phosphatase-like [Athalia rosae]|uniref:glycerol-3-phosphate phosphatase-like n=1 Tax=Athalia rosae TaxID=37344 RepID=UPI002034A3FE|nr:glycerol-3-phosphate phosphatase-like [Athalia rosae]XP_048513791.1 glycerol-3-phosphate phosphatase-like [Athalia rosae]XP_048513792.1 glycerol-3-phosphate phosphatase-like [Athalia rosae]
MYSVADNGLVASGKLEENSKTNSNSRGPIPDLRDFSKQELQNFLDSFDTILSDCDGVLWSCHTPIKGSLAALKELQEMGKNVYFVSNNSTLSIDNFVKKLERLGFPAKKHQVVVPSLVVAWYLTSIDFKGEAFVVGTTAFKNVLRDAGVKISTCDPELVDEDLGAVVEALKDYPGVKAIIHDFDPNASWMKIMRSVISLRRDDCIFIAAAMDALVPVGAKYPLLGTKLFTDVVSQTVGRQPILTAKPSQLLKEYVFKNCDLNGAERTVFVGDTITQDAKFASLCGFKKMFVTSGVATLEDALKEEEARPDIWIPSLGDFLPLFEGLNSGQNSSDQSL